MNRLNAPIPILLAGLGSSAIAQMSPPARTPFAALSPAAAAPDPVAKEKPRYDVRNGFTLAFVDADVRRVVDAVFGSMLHADYAIDPKITGTVTLRTARPVTADALVPLLETALQAVDAAILYNGTTYRIVARAEARTRAPMFEGKDEARGYVTEIVTLKYASAREMARLLGQFLGKEIVAGTEPSYNQIILSGTADERRAARTLIDRFDVDSLAGVTYTFIKLDNADPDTIVAELEKIFKPPLDIIGTRVRIVSLPRMHAVLAIAADHNDISRIEPWIRRLDAGGSGKRKLYSYAVQNGRARQLAVSLQLVLGVETSSPPPAPAAQATGFSAEPSGLSTNGTASTGQSMLTGGTSREPSDTIGAQTPLPGSSTPLLRPGGGDGPRVVPSDDTNSLLIYANGEEYDLIKSTLEKIDLPVPQVLIEATLAEVTLTKDLSAGVDWSFLRGNSNFTLSNSTASVPTAVFPGFSYSYLGATAQVVLNTLQSKTKVRVLSAPKLLVLNNQTATLQVGDQVPIVTQQSQSVSAAGAPVVNSIELHDTGVILKVTPRVNESGTVMLDIAQEVSDVTPTTTSGINSPTIQQRRLTTTVATRSGQMIALGGLIRNTVTRQKSGIPFLSQIPIVGAAFGKQINNDDQTELIILLTPTVLRTPADIDATVNELLDRMDNVRPMVQQGQIKAGDVRRQKP